MLDSCKPQAVKYLMSNDNSDKLSVKNFLNFFD
jgi:hypothetical protein